MRRSTFASSLTANNMSFPKKKIRSISAGVALSGVCAAIIFSVKLALSFLPNIEAVTFFTALFSYTFGIYGILASVIFVTLETLVYGFGSWVISYYIYWPLLALVFAVLGKASVRGRVIPTAVAVFMTFLFGIITSLVEVGLFSGYFDNFLYRFFIYYSRGAVFYILQIGCNAVVFPLLFQSFSGRLKVLSKNLIK